MKEASMKLTSSEKFDLVFRITELVNIDVLNREDRDNIFRVCLVACDREMAKVRMKKYIENRTDSTDRSIP